MSFGFWASVIVGIGVAGHAVVGVVLTTPLSDMTRRLWSPFGEHGRLLWLNGLLLAIASLLHLAISLAKTYDAEPLVLWSSVAPFVPFAIAGWLQMQHITAARHHAAMALGWLAFAAHALVGTTGA